MPETYSPPQPRLDAKALAERWRAENPDGWRMLVELAEADHASGRHGSINYYTAQVRFTKRLADGKPYKLDNRMAPVFARMLIREHPHLANTLTLRPSEWDPPMVPSGQPQLFPTGDDE